MAPGRNFYPAEQQTSSEMAIHRNWTRAEDLDLIVQHFDAGSSAIELKALVKPLVNFIWLAGVVFLAGSLIALWPDAREQRRLASRYARSSVAAPA
jgi:cytochrome c biogenesis factor